MRFPFSRSMTFHRTVGKKLPRRAAISAGVNKGEVMDKNLKATAAVLVALSSPTLATPAEGPPPILIEPASPHAVTSSMLTGLTEGDLIVGTDGRLKFELPTETVIGFTCNTGCNVACC